MFTNNFQSLFFLLAMSFLGFSQNEEVGEELNKLQNVTVTATRTEKNIDDVSVPIIVISKKQLEKSNIIRLTKILEEQTGLITVEDFGGVEGIQIQGMSSDYVMILVDGVPLVGRSAGSFDLNRLTVGNVERIEIVKGASSSLYGSEALGGVINIITDKPEEGIGGNVNFLTGSNALFDVLASFNYKEKSLGITTFFNRNSSAGYDLDPSDVFKTQEAFYNYTVSANLTYDISERSNLLFSSRLYTSSQDYVPNETDSGTATLDEFNVRAKFSTELNNFWSIYADNYVTQYKTKENLINENKVLENQSYFNQLFVRPELRVAYSKNENENIIFGIGITHEVVERLDFLENPEFTYGSIYVQYDRTLFDKLNFILGARYDSHSNYQSQLSPKFSINYKFSDKIKTKASIGYGYKAPDFRQLYFDFTNVDGGGYTVLGYEAVSFRLAEMIELGEIERIIVPISEFENSSLKPESSITINWGVDYKLSNKLKFSINFFRNDFKNLIDTQVIANKTNGANVFSYQNIDEVYTQGFEFNSQVKILRDLVLTVGYQLLYAKDKTVEEQFENGSVFARDPNTLVSFPISSKDYFGLFNRSRHTANAKLFYENREKGIDFNIRGTYRSKYAAFDSNSNIYLDNYDEFIEGYSIWDVALNKQLFKKYTIGIGADNILNFTDAENITTIPGRIIYGKLNFKF